jgi:hypothetical protein
MTIDNQEEKTNISSDTDSFSNISDNHQEKIDEPVLEEFSLPKDSESQQGKKEEPQGETTSKKDEKEKKKEEPLSEDILNSFKNFGGIFMESEPLEPLWGFLLFKKAISMIVGDAGSG